MTLSKEARAALDRDALARKRREGRGGIKTADQQQKSEKHLVVHDADQVEPEPVEWSGPAASLSARQP
jgi:hypothetical protein